MEYQILLLGAILSIFVRWSISRFPYSGAGKPPLYGDYEAQRHWQEITVNLPIEEWYKNGTDNDLLYWGLDYPPLTAYHSYMLGKIAYLVNPKYVELHKSRGFESYEHKLFMRYTVLFPDIAVYFTGIFAYWFFFSHKRVQVKVCAIVVTLLSPALILIDYGHFQYNSISLGLFVWAFVCLTLDVSGLLTAILFVMALNYKQMELYHALPFFCFLIGSIWKDKTGFRMKGIRILALAATVILTFAILWAPFLFQWRDFVQVVLRIFPFDRGLFEDKVANVWCSLSILIKWRKYFTIDALAKISTVATIFCLMPSAINLLLKPTMGRLLLALVNSSLVFFLLSFQVHEKSILLAAVPVSMILPYYPLPCLWFAMISCFSMFHLLVKDGLTVAFYALCILFFIVTYNAFLRTSQKSDKIIRIAFVSSMFCAFLQTVVALLVKPPLQYPDLYPLLNAVYSCGHFILFTVYFHYLQFTTELDIDGYVRMPEFKKSFDEGDFDVQFRRPSVVNGSKSTRSKKHN